MADAIKKTSISTDLDDHEVELLASLFREHIGKNREMAKVEHAVGEIDQATLDWQLLHADFIEAIANKLFPGWGKP